MDHYRKFPIIDYLGIFSILTKREFVLGFEMSEKYTIQLFVSKL